MCTFILPLILNLLLILYCITNLKTKYNIIYIIWLIFSIVPIINWISFIAMPICIFFEINDYINPMFELKPTKLNKFLFDYEKGED